MAFIRNTDKLVEGASKLFFNNIRAKAAVQSDLDGLTAEDVGIKLRLDIIEGGAGVVGSIAKAQADAQSYADQKIAALVNSAPEVLNTLKELSDALGGDANFASTVAGQIGSVDSKVDQEILDRQGAVSALQSSLNSEISNRESGDNALDLRLDVLEMDPVTKSYVDGEILAVEGQISAEQSRAEAAEAALDGRLDILEQDPTTKSYVDGQIGNLEGQPDVATFVGQLSTSVFSSISAEQSRAEEAEGLLSGRLDVLESDPVTKTYVDGEVSDLQGQITQEISDRQAAVSAEETRAMSAESALDGRLDILEQDPTTKSYVDGEVSDLQGQITQEISDRQSAIQSVEGMVEAEETRAMAAESALDGRLDALELDPVTKTYVDGIQSSLDGRLDVLESDPVTKSYVDGEVSGLQGQVDVEKGRIDAILSASEADKDSFAEIVSLINSVDTANDSAFAGYVLSNDAAVEAVEGRLDVIEGSGEGSVSKAEQDAKDYADGLDSAMSSRVSALEADPVTKSYVDSEMSAEETARMGADNALDARLDVLELDPVTKSYVDGADSTLQSNINGLFASKTTSDLAEGSRLYYTQARFDSAFSAKSTSNLTEGSNQYFTEARAKSAAVVNSSSGSQTDQAMSVSAAKSYIDTADNARLKLDGSAAMTGALNFSSTLSINQAGSAVISATAGQMLVFTRGMRVPYAATSANTTVAAPSGYITGVSSVSSPRTITLPIAASMGAGRMLVIKDETGAASTTNYIRIQPSGGQTIDGESYYDIVVPYESVMIYTNGTSWFIM